MTSEQHGLRSASEGARVLLVGRLLPGALERSYKTAFEALGCNVRSFDIVEAIDANSRLGLFGKRFNKFVAVESWDRKGNRELIAATLDFQPDYLVTFGQYPILAGALAQIRCSTTASLIHVWPDTLLNLSPHLISCLPLFDIVATYSMSSMEPLRKLGADRVEWVPLAGDPAMHSTSDCSEEDILKYGAAVTFVGGWRPEREAILSRLGAFDLKIWGPDWGRRCRGNATISKSWQGRPLYEKEFAKAAVCSKINLNIIDPLNYPAANMRFFELGMAGGFQVSSACPEMEEEFIDGEHLCYYRDDNELPALLSSFLDNTELRAKVSQAGHERVSTRHTYTERARSILGHFENGRA